MEPLLLLVPGRAAAAALRQLRLGATRLVVRAGAGGLQRRLVQVLAAPAQAGAQEAAEARGRAAEGVLRRREGRRRAVAGAGRAQGGQARGRGPVPGAAAGQRVQTGE
jgi:hypothetical protein